MDEAWRDQFSARVSGVERTMEHEGNREDGVVYV